MMNDERQQWSLEKEWIEIFPYGVTIGADESRPVMIFKDETEQHVLPVWISPQEAHISMAQLSNSGSGMSPHSLTFKYFKEAEVVVEQCKFVKIQGHHQFVDVKFKSLKTERVIQARAGDIMSFCLHSKAKFYCTLDHMQKSRQVSLEMENQNLGRTADSINVILDGDERFIN